MKGDTLKWHKKETHITNVLYVVVIHSTLNNIESQPQIAPNTPQALHYGAGRGEKGMVLRVARPAKFNALHKVLLSRRAGLSRSFAYNARHYIN